MYNNKRSEAAKQRRFSRKHANNILLRHSFKDKIRAEIVHTKDTDKIVRQKLREEFPDTKEAVFQEKVLFHDFGTVLAGPHLTGAL